MPSVLTSTRQVPLATTFYKVPSSGAFFYELSPKSVNYPSGNVPVGTMVPAAAGVGTGVGIIARDMGKTVQENGVFYREIQLLQPNPVASPDQAGIIGGGLTQYGIYYIVVPISGFSSGLGFSGFVPLAGGQM